jgi:hypothetical protein
VGAKGEDYCYTVTLGKDIFAVVLDLGEDHEDDWWEYYGTARFDIYRAQQTRMLEDILAAGEYEDYRYRLALCHIPVVYVDGKYETFRQEWTALLNEMEIDICLSGHKHKLWPLVAGLAEPNTPVPDDEDSFLTDHAFPNFLVGRRSLTQAGDTQQDGYDQYTGLYVRVDLRAGEQTACYMNSNYEILDGVFPVTGESFRTIQMELNRKK